MRIRNVLPLVGVVLMVLSSCSRQGSATDLVYFSDVNEYLTEEDIAKGNRRTHAQMPPVQLSHRVHEKKSVECESCHHRKENPARIKRCSVCHRGIKGVEDMHGYCFDCHTKENGPLECDNCHHATGVRMDPATIKEYLPEIIYEKKLCKSHKEMECVECHHKEKGKGPDEMVKCGTCHNDPVPRMRIMHFFCSDCHKKENEGPVTCQECHQ